ncbi:MAG: Crp/Fnr family transcriptional regulator [Verrucomicrobia bacterium]|nr:Crp/Fnr family transcriptional regulator [Verrucomicrobiota bacterium]
MKLSPPVMDITAILAQVNFFGDLSEASRRALAELCIPREVAKGDVLFREGDEGHSVYICNRGRVRLHKAAPDGTEVVLKIVRPGETFAEVVLFERGSYPVTATALEPCGVFLIPRREVRALLRREDFRDDFIGMLMRKLRHLAERVPMLTTSGIEDRLFHFLDEQFGAAPSVQSGISKKEAAAAIGTTPETLSRLLARLESEGRLRWRGPRIDRSPAGTPRKGTGKRSGA